MPALSLMQALENAFGPAHPEPQSLTQQGRLERLVRPTDVPAKDVRWVLEHVGMPPVRGAWPLRERADGYAAR